MDDPCGVIKMMHYLRRLGHTAGEKLIRRLMRSMNLLAIHPKPRLSQKHPEHRIYPYLLRGVEIIRANQVWATDITYIQLARGFCYLVVIMDWFSRYVLAWRLSNTLMRLFAWNVSKKPCVTGDRRSSITIRAHSSRRSILRRSCWTQEFGSAWTGEAGSLTIFLSSVFGVR